MRVWLDDERPMPADYNIHARTASEAIALLETGQVTQISLDHDLGPPEAGTGYDVAKWIEEAAFHGELPPLDYAIHTANPVGRQNIRACLWNAIKFWSESEASDNIDPDAWQAALDAMRGRPGMGACKLERDPYLQVWRFEINFADNSRFVGRHQDVNRALRRATELVLQPKEDA